MAGTGGDLTNTMGAISPFDTIKHQDEGGDYWSARELAALLGYSDWRNFVRVVAKAKEACEGSGQAISDHFVGITNMVTIGSGAQREVEDFHLSRYACYLIVQNGDPTKDAVALGQTYFAVRTRQDEVNAERDEMRQRVAERDKLARYRKALYKTARAHGVIAPQDFAVFENHGYQGLYHETAEEILARKGRRPTDNPADSWACWRRRPTASAWRWPTSC
jgi:DNA-damage-inducible protein D